MLRIDNQDTAEDTSAGNNMNRAEDTCTVTCRDNGKSVLTEVLDFKFQQRLTVVLNKTVKLSLDWNGKEYVTERQGLEFVTAGPKVTKIWDGKR
jgi:hypothetical protein